MKVLTVVGARPQFIKAAPVGRALREAGHHEILVHTGQHYDDAMADVFFRELEIPKPDVNLGVGSGSHASQTGQMLIRLEKVLLSEKPDLVLIYGDTNSTLAGALAACKLHIAVAHVEAGMRSFRRDMPEEINRVLSDHVSDLLFCATLTSVENLRREGIREGVHLVGDVMYDACLLFLPLARKSSRILEELGVEPRGYVLMTAHRAETVDHDERLRELMAQVAKLDATVIFPAHPRTQKRLEALCLLSSLSPRFRVVPPVGYLDMLILEAEARVVLTDSGGVQREAFFLSVPSVILRNETEWPELIQAGASALAGPNFSNLPVDGLRGVDLQTVTALFGHGDASKKIAREVGGGGEAKRTAVTPAVSQGHTGAGPWRGSRHL
jgi:UDP-N-acetylglucosamine 2-epimerase